MTNPLTNHSEAWTQGFIEGKRDAGKFYDLAITNAVAALHSVEALKILRDTVGIETPFDAQAILEQLSALIREDKPGNLTPAPRHIFLKTSAEPSFCAKCGESEEEAHQECQCR